MNNIIFFHKHINLFGIGVPKIGEVHFRFCISIILNKLHHNIVLVVMTACSTITQRIRRQPHREIRTQSGIAEIQLRGFAEPLQFIVGIRCKQIDNVKPYQHFQPFLCGTRCNTGRFSQRCVIDLFRYKGSTPHKELAKPHSICNTSCLSHVPHQISVNIRVEIFLPQLVIHALHLRHTALPNVIEHLKHVIFGKFTLSCLQGSK